MLAVVHPQLATSERRRQSAKPRAGFVQRHGRTGFGASQRSGDPRQAAAAHGESARRGAGHSAARANAVAATRIFWAPERDSRRSYTLAGDVLMTVSRWR